MISSAEDVNMMAVIPKLAVECYAKALIRGNNSKRLDIQVINRHRKLRFLGENQDLHPDIY